MVLEASNRLVDVVWDNTKGAPVDVFQGKVGLKILYINRYTAWHYGEIPQKIYFGTPRVWLIFWSNFQTPDGATTV